MSGKNFSDRYWKMDDMIRKLANEISMESQKLESLKELEHIKVEVLNYCKIMSEVITYQIDQKIKRIERIKGTENGVINRIDIKKLPETIREFIREVQETTWEMMFYSKNFHKLFKKINKFFNKLTKKELNGLKNQKELKVIKRLIDYRCKLIKLFYKRQTIQVKFK